jgi:hypothetical protein
MRATAGHGKVLSYYDWGATPFWSLQSDQRFTYTLYVPQSYDEAGTDRWPLVVLIHGTERGAATYRDKFADFAEKTKAIVLCPLFPGGVTAPGELDSYKLLRDGGVAFDDVLNAMVDEVGAKYRLWGSGLLIHGFSGGGHFAHRYLFAQPNRLAAVSIGAPGVVTLLDDAKPWKVGVGGFESVFGKAIDLEAIRKVQVQCVIGGDDTETWEITIPETSPWWQPGINDAGANRLERLRSLADSLEGHGVQVRFDAVAGVAHAGWSLLEPVQEFFAAVIRDVRDGARDAL